MQKSKPQKVVLENNPWVPSKSEHSLEKPMSKEDQDKCTKGFNGEIEKLRSEYLTQGIMTKAAVTTDRF